MRGDITGMFILFVLGFLGIWQIVIAVFRLNGLSLTGYPDRRWWSAVLGAALVVGSCAWYFSRPGHFAAPDVEGIETLIVLVGGLILATLVQALLASAAMALRRKRRDAAEWARNLEEVELSVGGASVPASFKRGTSQGMPLVPVLLLHDYAGVRQDLGSIAASLSAQGHAILAVDLDGHGDNPRDAASDSMEELLDAAAMRLQELTGSDGLYAIGVGFGGALAIELARRGVATRAVAVDPPARDPDGYAAINATRELWPAGMVGAFIKPPVRGQGGKRASLAKLIKGLPVPGPLAPGTVTVLGTRGRWLNRPEALGAFTTSLGTPEPAMLPGNHTTMPLSEETHRAILEALT